MLRAHDFLLTFAAISLLIAALNVRPRVIRASAEHAAAAMHQPGERASAPKSHDNINLLMHKIKRNLEQKQSTQASQTGRAGLEDSQAARVSADENHNSYTHYANQTSMHSVSAHELQPRLSQRDREPKEVRLEFLRSSSPADKSWQQVKRLPNSSTDTTTLYMLNHSPLGLADENDIETGEQQQQPPYTMFPMFNSQQPPQQPLNGQSPDQNPHIRQILNNYQRYPQAHQANPAFNQRLGHQAVLRQSSPAGGQNQALGGNVVQAQPPQQPLQPFSPIQLLTAPFQAFLPGLGQTNNQHSPPSTAQPVAQTGRHSYRGKSMPVNPAQAGQAGQSPQSAPQLPGLFNPFAAAIGQNGQNQQQLGQQQQVPGLQALYQQLPLYQALLAARQRQEALQAAQKMRQQQQQNPGVQQQNYAVRGQNTPQGAPGLNQQPVWPPSNQFGNQPISPVQQPPMGQPQPNPNTGPVQFDDEAPNNGGNSNGNSQAPSNNNESNNDTQEPASNGNQDQNDNHNRQPEQNQSDNNNNQPDTNSHNGDSAGDQSNEGQGGGSNQGGNEGKPEEEDPDLKQFQNLANGGDSFTDLFPPGILSNNDISEIKKQQDEQAKKQEEEERRKQMQNHNQQNNQPAQFQPNQQSVSQPTDQPINQFTNNDSNNNQPQNNEVDPNVGNNNGSADNNGANEENNSSGEDQGDGNEEGGNQDNDGEGGGGGGGEGEGEGEGADSPTVAALTSKSASSDSFKRETDPETKRMTKSPGVVYS